MLGLQASAVASFVASFVHNTVVSEVEFRNAECLLDRALRRLYTTYISTEFQQVAQSMAHVATSRNGLIFLILHE
jgi:hypothetical protein